jgi:hypothetical protein
MRWPRRFAAPHHLPDDVRARLRLDRHERVLAAAALEDGGWLVTSSTALLLADAGPDVDHEAGHHVRQGAGRDARPDARQNAGQEAGQGAGPEAWQDAGQEARQGAGLEACQDAGQGAGPDDRPDAGTDADKDVGHGLGPDVGQAAGPDDRPVVRHLWHEVAEATWEPEERVLVVRWATSGEPAVRLRLAEPLGAVPEVVRERVMSTYVLSQRVSVRGRRGVTVAVRRHAVDGSLLVQTVPDAGIDLGRPETAERVAALARELAQQVGLHG